VTDKVTTMADAAALVRPGDTLSLGGMTLYRRPMAFVRELLRQGTGDLTLLAMTAGLEGDLLVGAGRVRRVRTCYFGLEVFGLAPMFTQLASQGQIEIVEETEASLAWGLRAALAGLGFLPGPGWLGTDLPAVRPDVKLVEDPYSGQSYMAYPALRPDVAVIHVPVADRQGNAALIGNLGIDREIALLAGRTIITAERLVDSPADFGYEADIGYMFVTAVVKAPGGAAPTSCYPHYPLDAAAILEYVQACQRGDFPQYLAETVKVKRET